MRIADCGYKNLNLLRSCLYLPCRPAHLYETATKLFPSVTLLHFCFYTLLFYVVMPIAINLTGNKKVTIFFVHRLPVLVFKNFISSE
ncbi:hypothetical protein KsCSTR_37730 [Candidatus Kuenenia stuttgartiensis]|uniref:Uncharacterized protein n=1 Tax=Kuenenia stuttgartiensis TaxID=174633 RepID=Q1Q641_KUEST|nr:hypothetical protein KsCSTR_37730 [Candidatus Kuenenia stuttgartiensis]CAJ73048.1 unknown protein [Candidatus Kuenenia stuttgartiensis]